MLLPRRAKNVVSGRGCCNMLVQSVLHFLRRHSLGRRAFRDQISFDICWSNDKAVKVHRSSLMIIKKMFVRSCILHVVFEARCPRGAQLICSFLLKELRLPRNTSTSRSKKQRRTQTWRSVKEIRTRQMFLCPKIFGDACLFSKEAYCIKIGSQRTVRTDNSIRL